MILTMLSAVILGGYIFSTHILKNNKTSKSLLILSLAIHLILLLFVWFKMGYPPFINGYGSMVFFSFIIVLKTLFFHKDTPLKLKQFHIIFAELMLVGSFFMPFKLAKVQAVLTSYWLGIHVPLFFIGYLSLTTAFFASFFPKMKKMEKKEMKLALLFIFAGIATGAFWAEVSWGRFWGWDSKEVWALSTWLFVSSYFHFNNEKEKKMAIITAFISMILTYIVVSFLVPGAHNYFQ